MSESRYLCPRCGSADTVSYWQKENREEAEGKKLRMDVVVLRSIYPNVRTCVDCGAITGLRS